MSNFVYINGKYINTDRIESLSFDTCTLKSGQVIRGNFISELRNLNQASVTAAEPGATSFYFMKDDDGGFFIEEFPIVAWSVVQDYPAKPVYFFIQHFSESDDFVILHGIRSKATGFIYWEDNGYTLEELKEIAKSKCQ